LRLSPISGPDLKAGVRLFVERCLEADSGLIENLPVSAFKRTPTNRNSTIKDEVIVTFLSTQDRDYVKSLAYKLAAKKDHSVRLELPAHLLGQHRVLSAAGQELRSGRTGSRTTIKFDDDNMRLIMDYRVPNGQWKRLCPEQASGVVSSQPREIQETSTEEFRGLLRPLTGANLTEVGQ
jgi:hypothetical protein